jgi:excisionase family DNA binding protein
MRFDAHTIRHESHIGHAFSGSKGSFMFNADLEFDLGVMERSVCAEKDDDSGDKKSSRTWITPKEAAKRAQVSKMTVYRWIETYGIGWRVAGRFRVDPEGLERIISGENPVPPRNA